MVKEIIQSIHAVAWVFSTGLWWITFAGVIETGLPAPWWLIPDILVSALLGLLGFVWIFLEGRGHPTAWEQKMEARRLGMVCIDPAGRVYFHKEDTGEKDGRHG